MPGVTDQIKKYQSAVGQRNKGSQPSSAQMQKAQNTSIGRTRGTITSSAKGMITGTPRMSVSNSGRKPRPDDAGNSRPETPHQNRS